MIIRNVELETVCGVTSRLPENILPEFALTSVGSRCNRTEFCIRSVSLEMTVIFRGRLE